MKLRFSDEQKEVLAALKVTVMTPRTFGLMAMGILLMGSALSVVTVKNSYRKHFIELQSLQSMHDRLQTEWAQLLLEESTFGAHVHVEDIAEQSLNMVVPNPKDIHLISLPKLPAEFSETPVDEEDTDPGHLLESGTDMESVE